MQAQLFREISVRSRQDPINISFYCLQDRRSGITLMFKALTGSHAAAGYSLAIIQFNGSDRSRDSNSSNTRCGAQLLARSTFLSHTYALCGRSVGSATASTKAAASIWTEARATASSPKPTSSTRWVHIRARVSTLRIGSWWSGLGRTRSRLGRTGSGLELCLSAWCGRMEMGRDEFKKCGACERAKYCSRACQHHHNLYGGHMVVCAAYGIGFHIIGANGDPADSDDDDPGVGDDGEPAASVNA